MGYMLARRGAVGGRMVMGIPRTGIHAVGYAGSGIPFGEGFIKDHYIHRRSSSPANG